MGLGITKRSFGRIFVNFTRDEAYSLTRDIISELKFDVKIDDPSKYYFEGKTRLSWTKNKFAEKFFILIKNGTAQSVIDIYYNGLGVTGPDTKVLIMPFYKKLMEKTGFTPELQTCFVDIEEESIIKSADEVIQSNMFTLSQATINTDDYTVQDPLGSTEQTLVEPQTMNYMPAARIMSIEQMKHEIGLKHDQFKAQWDKNGVIQFKTEHIAILQRTWGAQVQFIIAYDQLTKEGYRLVAIDEGKSGGQASGGFTGGVNAYFYFQKIDYVK